MAPVCPRHVFEWDEGSKHSADEYSESQWRQSRLDEFHALDARGGSEALRVHLAKELFHCHHEMLQLRRPDAAARHLDELRGIVARHVEDARPSRLVKAQWLWFARTLVEAMPRAPSHEACAAMLAELSLARAIVGDTQAMRGVWVAGLEHACAVAFRSGRGIAVEHLSSLSSAVDRRSREHALSLARALAVAHRDAVRRGAANEAVGHLDELRALAQLPTAEGYARAALTDALRLARCCES